MAHLQAAPNRWWPVPVFMDEAFLDRLPRQVCTTSQLAVSCFDLLTLEDTAADSAAVPHMQYCTCKRSIASVDRCEVDECDVHPAGLQTLRPFPGIATGIGDGHGTGLQLVSSLPILSSEAQYCSVEL